MLPLSGCWAAAGGWLDAVRAAAKWASEIPAAPGAGKVERAKGRTRRREGAEQINEASDTALLRQERRARPVKTGAISAHSPGDKSLRFQCVAGRARTESILITDWTKKKIARTGRFFPGDPDFWERCHARESLSDRPPRVERENRACLRHARPLRLLDEAAHYRTFREHFPERRRTTLLASHGCPAGVPGVLLKGDPRRARRGSRSRPPIRPASRSSSGSGRRGTRSSWRPCAGRSRTWKRLRRCGHP